MKKACIVALSILMIAYQTHSQSHTHGATPDGDGQFNPFVASNPRGGVYLVYIERRNGLNNVWLRTSSDGENYSIPVRVNDRDGDATVRNENPPKVIAGRQGEVYVCWANEPGKWKGNIRFARSTDAGLSFSPAININSDADREPAGHAFQSLAVDSNGRIYIAWIDERSKQKEDRGAEMWLAVSTDNGRSFSHDRRILGDVCECCRTNLQVDEAGNIFLAYRTVPRSGPMYRDIMLARSRDGGKSFAATVVSHDGWEINGCPIAGPSLSLDPTGTLAVVWFMGGGPQPGLYYAYSTNAGKTFSPRRALDSQQVGKHAQTARLADGRLFVTWDFGTDKPATAWGVLDRQKGLLEMGTHEGVTYPVVASIGSLGIVIGVRSATRDIVSYLAR